MEKVRTWGNEDNLTIAGTARQDAGRNAQAQGRVSIATQFAKRLNEIKLNSQTDSK